MQDRTPTPGQEGRVLITPENGSAPYYATIEMADNPTQAGTPLNKETLLQDSTETEIFGDIANRTVDEAFMGIMGKIALIMQNVASMTLTVTDTAGTPLQGVYVSGVFDEDGNATATNASGQIVGYVAEGTTNLSVSGYADIADYSEQFDAVKGQSYTKTIAVTTRNFLRMTSSGNVRFSGNVEQLDVNPVGGGGGGSSSNGPTRRSGSGGGGGYSVIQNNVSFVPNQSYRAIVGSAGIGGNHFSGTDSGTAGGTSSALGVSAGGGGGGTGPGGAGGTGNGNGGSGVTASQSSAISGNNGGAGTQNGFSSFSEMQSFGGGGGSGAAWGSESPNNASGGVGGNPFGGDGAGGFNAGPGNDATGFGGGGGGGSGNSDNYFAGGNGYQGCVNFRMHLKSAA